MYAPPHAVVFCLLLKIYSVNPYLKILNLQIFLLQIPMYEEKNPTKIVLLPLRAYLNMGLKIAHV